MSENKPQIDASCRVALAAFLRDIGKFAERARIDKTITDEADNHASYTACAIDNLKQKLPSLDEMQSYPFSSDDALIDAAKLHHRPETFLQWIIASADRLAAGFECEEFATDSETQDSKNHDNTRQLTLMEQISLNQDKKSKLDWCYDLQPLSPKALFPQKRASVEHNHKQQLQQQYQTLWQGFVDGLGKIPKSHRSDLALWLDHFETLWGIYAYAIPSATAGKVKPDVSLYDHSRTTAALAVALWQYHRPHDPEQVRKQLKAQWGVKRQQQDEVNDTWAEEKFLLIQGDFFGIQSFIFSSGSETQKKAAKLLRGRSFYISLLTECAALKVLEALDLPSTSQVTNAAGKFLIVAPNTKSVRDKLKAVQQELDKWFLTQTFGQSGIGLAWLAASANDFIKGQSDKESPFQDLIKRLFKQLDLNKHRRLQLTESTAPQPVFDQFLDGFNNDQGVCAIDGRSAGEVALKGTNHYVSLLANDQIQIGQYLVDQDYQRILLVKKAGELRNDPYLKKLGLTIFDYQIAFTEDEQSTGRFKPLVDKKQLLRAFDFSLPTSDDDQSWHGYARRHINAYVATVRERDKDEEQRGKYDKVSAKDHESFEEGEIKTLSHLACDDRELTESGKWQGQTAIMTLKGDVDDLGAIFQSGLGAPTFTKMAALSRQMNAFFAIYLPYLCESEFQNTYTVFAGGDDFFLIGPWHSTIQLATRMQQEFHRYVAENPQVHFSVGLSMTKAGLPIRYLSDTAENALESAKSYKHGAEFPKNAVSCFSCVMSWADFSALIKKSERLSEHVGDMSLSRGYIYGLLNLVDMREALDSECKPEKAIWRSYFSYRTYRMLEKQRHLDDAQRKKYHGELAHDIAENGIETHKGDFRVALFTYLYQLRD